MVKETSVVQISFHGPVQQVHVGDHACQHKDACLHEQWRDAMTRCAEFKEGTGIQVTPATLPVLQRILLGDITNDNLRDLLLWRMLRVEHGQAAVIVRPWLRWLGGTLTVIFAVPFLPWLTLSMLLPGVGIVAGAVTLAVGGCGLGAAWYIGNQLIRPVRQARRLAPQIDRINQDLQQLLEGM